MLLTWATLLIKAAKYLGSASRDMQRITFAEAFASRVGSSSPAGAAEAITVPLM